MIQTASTHLVLHLCQYKAAFLSLPSCPSDNGLQLPRVAQHVLDHHLAYFLFGRLMRQRALVRVCAGSGTRRATGSRSREVDLAVLDGPTAVTSKVDNGAFGVEEEQRLGRAEGERRVGALATGGDLGADLGREDLRVRN